MATDAGELIVKLSADLKNLDSGLKQAKGQLSAFQSQASSFASTLKKTLAFAGVAVGIYEIASALKSFATDAAMVGARTETLGIAMTQVGKTYGVSAASLKLFVDELKGAGITTQESMLAVTKALTTGIPLDQLKDLATRARDIAVVAGINTSEAMNRVMQGIITGEQETLRRLMIQVGVKEDIYKRHAATLGTTADALNSVQKSQAMLNEVMRLSVGFAGAAAAADESVGKQLQSMARFSEEAKNALWALFSPVMAAGVQEMIKGWKDLKTWADANQDSLAAWGKEMAAWFKWLAIGIRDVGAFIAEHKELIKTFLQLYVASKAAGMIAGMGKSIKTTALEVGILAALLGKLKVLIGGPWRILITVTLYGLYEAWNAIQRLRQQAGFTPQVGALGGAIQEGRARDRTREGKELDIAGSDAALEAQRRGISVEKYLELAKEEQKRAIEGRYKKYTAPSVLPAVLPEHETAQERADREARTATKKAEEDAPKALDKAGKGAKAAKENADNLLASLLAMYKTKREAELQDAQNSLDLQKTTNEKTRAELEQSLATGLISGGEYYQRLQDLEKQEADSALAMIARKREAQKKAYQESRTEVEADTKLSDAAKSIALQKFEADNRKELGKLDTEAAQVSLDAAKKVTEELTRQLEIKRQYTQSTAQLEIDNAQMLGQITAQEAVVRRLYLDWVEAKRLAFLAGVTDPSSPAFVPGAAAALDKNKEAQQGQALYSGYASAITSGISSLVDALMDGGQDLKKAANSMFKSLFNEAMKPGLDALKNMLVSGFQKMFGEAGGGIASAVMGVIGIVGMLLTSSKKSSSFTASGVESGVTSTEAVRGIIGGDTSIPIAEISVSLSEALTPHLGVLRQIEANTRGGANAQPVNVSYRNDLGNRATTRESMEAYFKEYLLQGAGSR
ncbi:MAG: hypothetical protein KKD99_09625 [Proteobacteria bacterium]|nr:hypothetical protein [Pseudomonadota bacterium]MBU4355402.1 hypothetical protein [Pseudomonadota bacterium]MBU4448835.1 hypothetical protein [Pseudomonadota bacterium]MCG2772946.1 hypothetical protein [Desulfobacterales bacterium]